MTDATATPAPTTPAPAPDAPAESSGVGVAVMPTSPVPADPGEAQAALAAFRTANSDALYNPAHAGHQQALAQHRALADAAFNTPDGAPAKAADAQQPGLMGEMASAMADVPTSPTNYAIEPPHGLAVDPAFVGEMQGLALEMGLPAHVWKLASGEYMRAQSRGAFPSEDEISRMGEQSEAILRNAWGPEYAARLKAANSIIAGLPAEKQAVVKQLLAVSGLANDARLVMALASVADHRAQRAKR